MSREDTGKIGETAIGNFKGIEKSRFFSGAPATLDTYLRVSDKIPGWTRGDEARALADVACQLPENAIVVEIGSFFGSGTIILAGARKLSGSGKVHCVDPFDGSGDSFSVPYYAATLMAYDNRPLQELFDENIRNTGLSDWVDVHRGTAEEVGATWSAPIDLLFLDGDQSPTGSRSAYKIWSPWIRHGGIIALHNSNPRQYEPSHDGHHRLVIEDIRPPLYGDCRLVGSTTFARKASADHPMSAGKEFRVNH